MPGVNESIRPDSVFVRSHHANPGDTPFRRMAITHTLSAMGDVALIVTLANSFFSLSPNAARGKVLLYLLISFAPFTIVAPLIGPMVDRAAGGRRAVVQFTILARALCFVLIAFTFDSVAMFPIAFVVLVLQKTYGVSKSALVPSVVRASTDLVEANSKLSLLAAVCGGLAAVPFGVLSLISPRVTLIAGAAVFVAAFASAGMLPRAIVAAQPVQREESEELHQPRLLLAASAVALIRAAMGFLFFHVFFWLRTAHVPKYWIGIAIASVTAGMMIGNALAPLVRRVLSEEVILISSLLLVALSGLLSAVVGGVGAAVALSTAVNIAASMGRMAFESIVQRDAPDANQGRAFARAEMRFQLSWALAGVVPVAIAIPEWLGFLLVGLIGVVGAFGYLAGGLTRYIPLKVRAWRPTIPVLRTRKGSAAPSPRRAATSSDLPPPDPRQRR